MNINEACEIATMRLLMLLKTDGKRRRNDNNDIDRSNMFRGRERYS